MCKISPNEDIFSTKVQWLNWAEEKRIRLLITLRRTTVSLFAFILPLSILQQTYMMWILGNLGLVDNFSMILGKMARQRKISEF